MRSALRSESRSLHIGPVRGQVLVLSVIGLGVVAGAFGGGYALGRRASAAAMGSLQDEDVASEGGGDALARLDAERDVHDPMTFYSQLTKPASGGGTSLPPARPGVAAIPGSGRAGVPSLAPGARNMPLVPVLPAGDRTNPETGLSAGGAPTKSRRPAEANHVMGALAAGPARRGEFTVQVSSFQTQAEAKAFSASLERQGFKPFVVQASLPNKGTWYRVRLGRFEDEETAKVAKNILSRADIPGWILRSD